MRKGFSDEAAHLEELHARLNGETACVAWAELERFHARGILVHVRAGLDLVDVAARFAQDDAFSVSRWMEAGLISRLDDAQARDWLGRDPSLWAVVVLPWVLVQERSVSVSDSERRH